MIINWNDRRRVIHASPVLLPGGIVYRVAYAAALNQPVVNNDYVLFRRVNYSLGVHRADRAIICIFEIDAFSKRLGDAARGDARKEDGEPGRFELKFIYSCGLVPIELSVKL